jgi:hypothetical protein
MNTDTHIGVLFDVANIASMSALLGNDPTDSARNMHSDDGMAPLAGPVSDGLDENVSAQESHPRSNAHGRI